jgi:hypothetical protein
MHAVLMKGAPISFVARATGHTEQVEGELVCIDIGQELRWRRPVALPSAWWLRSERYLRITRLGVGESRFVQTERFAGFAIPFIWRNLRPKVEETFNEMNRALKIRAESRRNSGSAPRTWSIPSRRVC